MMRFLWILILSFFLAHVLLTTCASGKASLEKARDIPLEMPQSPEGLTEQIVKHKGFVLSYNKDMRIANWVAYELTSDEVGGAVKRNGGFYPNPLVLDIQATNDDYRNSGWDRGHLAPAGDMKWNDTAMLECCYLTNICPQNHGLNNGIWHELEKKCRFWAKNYDKVFIATGPVVKENVYGTIGYNQVVVPDAFFKVLMVKAKDEWNAVGFVIKNKADAGLLTDNVMSVDSVEKITGLDFFHALPDSVENRIEKYFNAEFWFGQPF